MNDKFSRLILLLQASLKKKTDEQDEILNKKKKGRFKIENSGNRTLRKIVNRVSS